MTFYAIYFLFWGGGDEDDGADSNRQQQFLTNGVRYINNLDFVLKNIQILILVTIWI